MTGSIAGAVVVTGLSAALADWPEFRMIIYALALLLLMFYRPQTPLRPNGGRGSAPRPQPHGPLAGTRTRAAVSCDRR